MNGIEFDIAQHWLPITEKLGSIEKDTLRIKVSGINFHTKSEPNSWGIFSGYIKLEENNINDSAAIAFYKSDGQLLGYVKKELQDYVNQFTNGRELDCIITITPFISKDNKIVNQAYATILKFFENDVEYATEMINRITEDAGHDALIETTHFEKEISSNNYSCPIDEETTANEETCNTTFRYDEFYKFPHNDKTGKKTYDTLTIKIENADWYFDKKKWQAGVYSGYLDAVHLESANQYGVYREDDTLVGCPNSFDFDDEIQEFAEGHRVFCIFMLVPHIDSKTFCIDIKGKAILIKFFEGEEDYARKIFEDTRMRLSKAALTEYKKFNEKKKEIEDGGDSVLLSWGFDKYRYKFGEHGTTYLNDDEHNPKSPKGCSAVIALFATISMLFLLSILVL